MNSGYFEWIKPWMGDRPDRLYKPEIYPVAIQHVAVALKSAFGSGADPQPWSGEGYRAVLPLYEGVEYPLGVPGPLEGTSSTDLETSIRLSEPSPGRAARL